jgi:hypothetical protein
MVMAQIYTMVGEYDKALDELDYLMSIPSLCSSAFLRADPIFTPLQNLPRFNAIVAKYDRK